MTLSIDRPQFVSGDVIKIRVGDGATPFTVHQDLIGHYSPYILEEYSAVVTDEESDRSKSPGLIKFEDDGIHLRDVKSQTMEIVLNWVYDQRLYKRVSSIKPEQVKTEQHGEEQLPLPRERATTDSSSLTEVSNEGSSQAGSSRSKTADTTRHDSPTSVVEIIKTTTKTITPIDTFDELLDLFIFAETYEFPLLKVAVIQQWQALNLKRIRCASRVVSRAYANLSSESKLISLLGYNHALWYRQDPNEAKVAEDGMPSVFFRDVLNWERAIKARIESAGGKLLSKPCEFHDHASKTEQARCDAMFKECQEEINWRKRKNNVERENEKLKGRISFHSEEMNKVQKTTKNIYAKTLKTDDDGLINEHVRL